MAEAARVAGGGRRGPPPPRHVIGLLSEWDEAGRERPSCTAVPGSPQRSTGLASTTAELDELERSFLAESQAQRGREQTYPPDEPPSAVAARRRRGLPRGGRGRRKLRCVPVRGGTSRVGPRRSGCAHRAGCRSGCRGARQLQRRYGGEHSRGGRGCRDHAANRRVRATRGAERAQRLRSDFRPNDEVHRRRDATGAAGRELTDATATHRRQPARARTPASRPMTAEECCFVPGGNGATGGTDGERARSQ